MAKQIQRLLDQKTVNEYQHISGAMIHLIPIPQFVANAIRRLIAAEIEDIRQNPHSQHNKDLWQKQ